MLYNSRTRLEELKDQLETYLPNLLPTDGTIKYKRDLRIRAEVDKLCHPRDKPTLDIYDLQLAGITSINDIIASQLLGMNVMVIPHFVVEYGTLRNTLELLNNEYKRLNQFQELKPFVTNFNLKELASLLYDDLTQLNNEYNIDFDVKETVKNI